MRRSILRGSALAIILAAAAVGSGINANAQQYNYGPGMMYGWGYGPNMMYGQGYGPNMMYGWGHGPNMMYGSGYGYGPGMMGPGWQGNQGNLNISPDDAKNYFERWIAIQGNPHIKVGDVKAKDADTIVVDIVTKDNSLVQRFLVNRHSGFYQPGEG